MKKFLCAVLAVVAAVTIFTSCQNQDPNVRQTETGRTSDTAIEKSGETTKENESYRAIGDGEEHIETVKDVKIDADEYALRGYELAFMFAQKDFDKIDEIPVDVLVQFAFCHIYFDNLYEMPHKAVVYRDTDMKEMKEAVEKYFGKNDVDLSKSILYTPGRKKFEMWQPEYGTNIYYTINSTTVKGSRLIIDATFFNEESKETAKGSIELTVAVKNSKPYISGLKTKYGS